MADVTWANVLAFAPTMDKVPDEARMRILAFANDINPNGFGGAAKPKYTLARILMAAHMGEIWKRQGVAGMIQHETIAADSISTSYGFGFGVAAIASDEALKSTSYGTEYLSLASTNTSRLPFVP